MRAILDSKLTFNEHLYNVLNRINKTIGLLSKLQFFLPRKFLVTIFKEFVRLHLNYSDVLYDHSFNNYLHEILEWIQYNAWLAIIRAIRGTFKVKYQELGLESLQPCGWFRNFVFVTNFSKINTLITFVI